MAREYRSALAWRGMPIVHVALGARQADGRFLPGRARGVVAVGSTAVGVVAVGLVAVGVVAVAPVALGVVALGAVAVGVASTGVVTVGVVAVGVVAVGVRAIGLVVAGGATTKLLALPVWWRGGRVVQMVGLRCGLSRTPRPEGRG